MDCLTDEEETNDDEIADNEFCEVPGQIELDLGPAKDDIEENKCHSNEPPLKKIKGKPTIIPPEPIWTKDINFLKIRTSKNAEIYKNKMVDFCKNLTPVETFELFFTSDISEYICNESQKYALEYKNNPNIYLSPKELKLFIGILFYSGY